MDFLNVTNLRWDNAEHASFTCSVVFPSVSSEPVEFCATHGDTTPHGEAIWMAGINGDYGAISEYVATVKTNEQIIQEFTVLVQKRLDDFARKKTYDGILSACTYATSQVSRFASDGQYCVMMRDLTWDTAQNILNQAIADGVVPEWADVEAALPALEWPN